MKVMFNSKYYVNPSQRIKVYEVKGKPFLWRGKWSVILHLYGAWPLDGLTLIEK